MKGQFEASAVNKPIRKQLLLTGNEGGYRTSSSNHLNLDHNPENH